MKVKPKLENLNSQDVDNKSFDMDTSKINIQELEYKFKAEHISLQQFTALMELIGYENDLEASSWDVYYNSPQLKNVVGRLRLGGKPELTIKRNTVEGNNWNRVEIDIPLDPSKEKELEPLATEFFGELGFEKNFKIFKTCFIYWNEHVNFVYYVVRDEEMKEVGRYIEVEVNKDKVNDLSDPFAVLDKNVKHLESIGLNPKTRLKRSLFEIYRKMS